MTAVIVRPANSLCRGAKEYCDQCDYITEDAIREEWNNIEKEPPIRLSPAEDHEAEEHHDI
jgi:hypothetical protein